MPRESRVSARRHRGAARRTVLIACALAACLLAVMSQSCRKEDFAMLVMAGYGVLDRLSTLRD